MQAWIDFLKTQEEKRGNEVIQQWLRPLKVSHFDSGNLYLEANDPFQILWFEEHIRPDLKSQLRNPNGRPIKVHLTLGCPSAPPTRPLKSKRPAPPQLSLIADAVNPLMTLEQFAASQSNSHLLRFFHELSGYNPLTGRYATLS